VYEAHGDFIRKKLIRRSYRRCRKRAVALMQRERLLRVHTEEETFLAYISARGRREHVM